MGQLLANVRNAPVTHLDNTPIKTLHGSDCTDPWRMRAADIADTPGLLAEAVYQYATLGEKSELAGHLIRVGELCPQVRSLLLDIAARAGRKYLLLRRLNAESATPATDRPETIEDGVLKIACTNTEVNPLPELSDRLA